MNERAFQADADGTRQTFVMLFPRDPASVETLVVALHGHGSHQEQFMTPGIFDDALGETVRLSQAENLLYVAPEYRGNSWMNAAAESDVRQIIRLGGGSHDAPVALASRSLAAMLKRLGG